MPGRPGAARHGATFNYGVSAPSGLHASGTFLGTDLPSESLLVTFTSGNVTAFTSSVPITSLTITGFTGQ